MKKQITIREAIAENDVAAFWEQLHAYYRRDLFSDPADEGLAYFLSGEYRAAIETCHDRVKDRCRYLFFHRDGQNIGFALPAIYDGEDGKCFILEFCVYPAFRGSGAGEACARALLTWAREQGGLYAELNCDDARRERFWRRVGFRGNGCDEWGEPLMILPPEERLPAVVDVLDDPTDWQLLKLENGFKKDIGEDVLAEDGQKRLQQAVKDGRITFFVAKRGCRAVGMCSVAQYYSTFTCANVGVFDDFFIEPVFRKRGIARQLARAAQTWGRENGIASLTVSCAPCDEEMYRALGFDTRLGTTLACLS